jgi:hypothetical protein
VQKILKLIFLPLLVGTLLTTELLCPPATPGEGDAAVAQLATAPQGVIALQGVAAPEALAGADSQQAPAAAPISPAAPPDDTAKPEDPAQAAAVGGTPTPADGLSTANLSDTVTSPRLGGSAAAAAAAGAGATAGAVTGQGSATGAPTATTAAPEVITITPEQEKLVNKRLQAKDAALSSGIGTAARKGALAGTAAIPLAGVLAPAAGAIIGASSAIAKKHNFNSAATQRTKRAKYAQEAVAAASSAPGTPLDELMVENGLNPAKRLPTDNPKTFQAKGFAKLKTLMDQEAKDGTSGGYQDLTVALLALDAQRKGMQPKADGSLEAIPEPTDPTAKVSLEQQKQQAEAQFQMVAKALTIPAEKGGPFKDDDVEVFHAVMKALGLPAPTDSRQLAGNKEDAREAVRLALIPEASRTAADTAKLNKLKENLKPFDDPAPNIWQKIKSAVTNVLSPKPRTIDLSATNQALFARTQKKPAPAAAAARTAEVPVATPVATPSAEATDAASQPVASAEGSPRPKTTAATVEPEVSPEGATARNAAAAPPEATAAETAKPLPPVKPRQLDAAAARAKVNWGAALAAAAPGLQDKLKLQAATPEPSLPEEASVGTAQAATAAAPSEAATTARNKLITPAEATAQKSRPTALPEEEGVAETQPAGAVTASPWSRTDVPPGLDSRVASATTGSAAVPQSTAPYITEGAVPGTSQETTAVSAAAAAAAARNQLITAAEARVQAPRPTALPEEEGVAETQPAGAATSLRGSHADLLSANGALSSPNGATTRDQERDLPAPDISTAAQPTRAPEGEDVPRLDAEGSNDAFSAEKVGQLAQDQEKLDEGRGQAKPRTDDISAQPSHAPSDLATLPTDRTATLPPPDTTPKSQPPAVEDRVVTSGNEGLDELQVTSGAASPNPAAAAVGEIAPESDTARASQVATAVVPDENIPASSDPSHAAADVGAPIQAPVATITPSVATGADGSPAIDDTAARISPLESQLNDAHSDLAIAPTNRLVAQIGRLRTTGDTDVPAPSTEQVNRDDGVTTTPMPRPASGTAPADGTPETAPSPAVAALAATFRAEAARAASLSNTTEIVPVDTTGHAASSADEVTNANTQNSSNGVSSRDSSTDADQASGAAFTPDSSTTADGEAANAAKSAKRKPGRGKKAANAAAAKARRLAAQVAAHSDAIQQLQAQLSNKQIQPISAESDVGSLTTQVQTLRRTGIPDEIAGLQAQAAAASMPSDVDSASPKTASASAKSPIGNPVLLGTDEEKRQQLGLSSLNYKDLAKAAQGADKIEAFLRASSTGGPFDLVGAAKAATQKPKTPTMPGTFGRGARSKQTAPSDPTRTGLMPTTPERSAVMSGARKSGAAKVGGS